MSRKNHAPTQAVKAAPEATFVAAATSAPETIPLAPAAPEPSAVVEVAVPTKINLRAVHGTMIHPFKPMDIRTDALTPVTEIDSWLKAQIDAKKIVVV